MSCPLIDLAFISNPSSAPGSKPSTAPVFTLTLDSHPVPILEMFSAPFVLPLMSKGVPRSVFIPVFEPRTEWGPDPVLEPELT
ncbi:hypothetical protein EVAR_31973_1 [Eumeta japonica]|uniref:Uncharacterized protein n=1 Tax=Eumeta variegata TaxID=151549 RepID=A0A4C1VRA0_EUMVA|nr:hypothetical protein EVAR_31973_1 [Eumeta japonica]